jgi:hypothetical protein
MERGIGMVNVPKRKSQYLDAAPTLDKVEELIKIQKFIGDVKIEDVKVTILQWGDKLERTLKDFPPDHLDGEESAIEYVDNLLYTMELNPPEEVILTLPNGNELYVTDNSEYNNILDECIDVSDKLNDCIDSLRSGNKLDETQESFLKMHNILE